VVPEIAVPMFGYKNHVGIDREYGFVRRYAVTHAAAHDGGAARQVLDRENTAASVWADSAYRSKANLVLLVRRGLRAEFQHKKPRRKAIPPNIARGNATRARIRSHIEHVLAAQKHRPGPSFAPSASSGRGQRSVSPISPITSPGWPGTTGEQRPHDREVTGASP